MVSSRSRKETPTTTRPPACATSGTRTERVVRSRSGASHLKFTYEAYGPKGRGFGADDRAEWCRPPAAAPASSPAPARARGLSDPARPGPLLVHHDRDAPLEPPARNPER